MTELEHAESCLYCGHGPGQPPATIAALRRCSLTAPARQYLSPAERRAILERPAAPLQSTTVDDGARALAILAELEQGDMPSIELHRARPLSYAADHEWEYYALVDGEKTGRHRSLLGCLAAVVEMRRAKELERK
jgi:hypothetical protein